MKEQRGNMALILLGVVGIFLALSIVGMAMNIITIPWLKLGSKVQMERDIVEKTYDSDNALYNYRWFKDRHEAIKATEKKLTASELAVEDYKKMYGDPSGWSFDVNNEYARLNSVTQGLRSHYEDIVGEYNSRAKQADRAIFQDELPLFFNLN